MAIKKATSGAENAHMLFLRSALCLLHQAQIQQCLSFSAFPSMPADESKLSEA